MATEPKYSKTVLSVPTRSIAELAYGGQNLTPAWQDLSSFRRAQTTAVLDGSLDAKYTYAPTAANIDFTTGDGGMWVVPFVHGLGYRPIATGTVYYENADELRHPLPWLQTNRDTSYGTLGMIVSIESVDALYIYVKFTIMDDTGLSLLLTNFASAFVFKFTCSTDTAV